jgi:hypothetical protein
MTANQPQRRCRTVNRKTARGRFIVALATQGWLDKVEGRPPSLEVDTMGDLYFQKAYEQGRLQAAVGIAHGMPVPVMRRIARGGLTPAKLMAACRLPECLPGCLDAMAAEGAFVRNRLPRQHQK